MIIVKDQMKRRNWTVATASQFLFDRYGAEIERVIKVGEPDPLAGDTRLCLTNLLWMCNEGARLASLMPEDKISRWLGFIQGCLAMRQLIDVDLERDLTRPMFRSAHEGRGITPCSLERELDT